MGIWDGIVNPIYECRVRMTPGINPIYAGLERSSPSDTKNVSYVDVGLVDLKVMGGWCGGLSKNWA